MFKLSLFFILLTEIVFGAVVVFDENSIELNSKVNLTADFNLVSMFEGNNTDFGSIRSECYYANLFMHSSDRFLASVSDSLIYGQPKDVVVTLSFPGSPDGAIISSFAIFAGTSSSGPKLHVVSGGIVVPNRNLLSTATSDEHQSEDELFFDCNTTLRSTTKASDANKTIDNLSAILNEANQILSEQGPSESGTQNQINANETVIVCGGENLNYGFINVTESSTRNLETNNGHFSTTDVSTENQDQATVQKQSADIKRLTFSNQFASVSTSLISDIENAAPAHSDSAPGAQLVYEQNQGNKSLSATENLNRLNETVNIVPSIDLPQNIALEPIDFSIKKVNSEDLLLVASSSVALSNEKILNVENVKSQSEDTQQSNETGTGNSTNSNSLVNDTYINNATTGTDAEAVNDHKETYNLLPEVHDSKVESGNLNKTVNIVVPIADYQQLLDSKLTDDNTIGVELEAIRLIPCRESASVGLSDEQLANITNDLEDDKPVATDIDKPVNVEAFRNDSTVGVELSNLGESKKHREEIVCETHCQESTFILTNNPSKNAVALESNSEQEDKAVAIKENNLQNNELSTLKQGEKIQVFEANQTISVDSLDANSETRDCSLDSIEMKQQLQHQPTIQSDEMMTDKDSAAISEALAISEPAIGSDLLTEDNSSLKMSVESEVPLVSDNVQNVNQSDFVLKSPLLPNSASIKMGNEQFQGGNTDFIVLNANDFDFLQSRGNNSFDPEEERRSSLLLRFDPLLKQRLSILPFAPAVHEESTEGEHSLHDIQPLVDLCSNTSGDNSSDGKGISTDATPPPQPTNEIAMSIGLVDNSNSKDNETAAYVNNIKSDRTEEKHVQIEGVPLTDKKIKFKYTDEDIQKRMEEYEATQEILLKRLTEKDKAIVKTSNVLELYEKAIAEVLAAKEKLAQTYEKTHEELKNDRDLNFQHLLSLESTFSDLHMKFERNIQYTTQLQEKLNALQEEKVKSEESLVQQEARYDKLTSHALQQFDIANAKLEQQTKMFSGENTKLKALIKREEIYKNAVQEELLQKKRENEELVKICDELISGQKS